MLDSYTIKKSKQKLLLHIMCAAVLLIMCVYLFSFLTTKRMLTNITKDNMAIILENSSQGRQLEALFADINIFVRSFLGKEDYIEAENARLIGLAEDLIKNVTNMSFKKSLVELLIKFHSFVDQCRKVNSGFNNRKITHNEIKVLIDNLEKLIGKSLITKTLNSEDTTFVEQLLILTVGYQQSLLEIDKLFAEFEPEDHLTNITQEKSPIIVLIDELILRLQTITVSVPYIAEISSQSVINLKKYRQIIFGYFKSFKNLNISKVALNKSKSNLISEMSLLDIDIYKTTKTLNKKIVRTIFISAGLGLLLTIMIITSLYLIIMNLFKAMDKEINDRIKVEQTLEKLNIELEKRVEERTSELSETNVILELSLFELKQTENSLRKSEERYRSLIHKIQIAVVVHTPDTKISISNPKAQEILGLSKEQLFGKKDIASDWYFFHVDGKKMSAEEYPVNQVLTTKQPLKEMAARVYRPGTDDSVWVLVYADPVFNDKYEIQQVIVTFVDVTDRIQAEERIRNSLKEKEVLLREIHHRVKNNLQVIISLMNLYSSNTKDDSLEQIFDDCRDKVRAMSLIHEILYQSDDLTQINFREYLKKLCRNLSLAHGAIGKRIAVNVARCNVDLNIDQSIAVGMVVSELISNAFKHAFPHGNGGSVSIGLTSSNRENVILIVQDDGKGMPPELDIQNLPFFGMRLVNAIVVRELKGTVDVENNNGTRFIIRFQRKKA